MKVRTHVQSIACFPNDYFFYEQLAQRVHTACAACLSVGTVYKAMFVTRSMVLALVDANLGLIFRIRFAGKKVSIIYK